ncbi:MAG TPA: ATP-binding protein, partial [Blastocatellia bacterium]|nr:ATP-binding protein [Blastocatellia bacterium]
EELITYAEDTIRIGLQLSRVKILVLDEEHGSEAAAKVLRRLKGSDNSSPELTEDIAALGGNTVYSLVRQGKPLGLMVVAAEPETLTSEKRAVLDVLAGQVAIGIETFQLLGEKIKLERELAMRERLAALGQMAATVAHEVKNPLSSIKSIAQVMREDEAVRNYSRDLELIVDEVDRLSRTVSQLLAFARRGEQPTPESGAGTIGALFSTASALVAADAERAEVIIRVEADCDLSVSGRLWAALQEIIPNLLLNAVQSSPKGEEVVIAARCEDGASGEAQLLSGTAEAPARAHLVVTVTDKGSGIPGSEQQRIFEPFYTTRPKGTGLGLAIVSRRVSELGGSVRVLSPAFDGFGTRFVVTLPIESEVRI